MIFTISGTLLMFFGAAVSIIFWIPSVVNRKKIREIMGKRYPLVYIIYIANGPVLIFFGLLLIMWPKIQ
jgi:hypothetical protein